MSSAVSALVDLLQQVPVAWRARIYKVVATLAALGTLALLVLPALPGLGVELPSQVIAIITAVAALLGALAKANTDAGDEADRG